MKRVALVLFILTVMVGALPAFAAESTISGTITGNTGFIENFDVGCAPFNDGLVYYYEVYTMTVSADGDYDYVDDAGMIDSFSGIYTLGGFDPANPLANCLAVGGDGTFTLAAGSYTLVVSTFDSEVTGDFSFRWIGPGNVTLGLPAAGCIPYEGVMGDIPLGAQAYFEPGKPADGVVVNAGTYYVVGTDATGGFYKIILACDYLWVPAAAVQPSYQSPWNGQPLPTTVVS